MRNTLIAGIVLAVTTLAPGISHAADPFPGLGVSSSNILKSPAKPSIDLKSMSLLDPSRFTMKQQTIMSYSSSNRAGSNMLGMYVNTMEYKFQMPLTMRLRVAYQNNMSGLFGNRSSAGGQGIDNGRLYIPSFDMYYQPWKNTMISFHYRELNAANMYANPYASPYGYVNPYGYGW